MNSPIEDVAALDVRLETTDRQAADRATASRCRLRRLAAWSLALVAAELAGGRAIAQLDRVAWEELPDRVAEKLVPIEQLRVADWPADPDDVGGAPRTVLQFIENTFYEWQEYDVAGSENDPWICIHMVRPNAHDLSANEAQVLLSASRLWVEAAALLPDLETLDASDPVFDLDTDEPFLTDEELSRFAGVGGAPVGGGDPDIPEGPQPESVIGSDERRRVTNTTSFPWRAITYISNRYSNGYATRGTGFLVGPYTVLTNGHMVYNPSRGGFATFVEVSPGQRQDSAGGNVTRPYGSRTAIELRKSSLYQGSGDFAYDYAAVLLGTPFSEITTYMPLVFNEQASAINIAGYPATVQGQSSRGMWHSFGDVVSVGDRIIRYLADSSGGNSGGPVWVYNSTAGTRRVIAVHALGSPSSNGGPRLVSANQSLITGWMNFTPGTPPPPPPPPPPAVANDLCGNATAVGEGTHSGSNEGAGTDGTASCGGGGSADVWWRYTSAASSDVTIETCGSNFDTVLSVLDACGGSEQACNDDACGTQSRVSFSATAGRSYLIRVAGFGAATGSITLNIAATPAGTADLRITSLTPSNSTPQIGQTFSMEARITNQGTQDAGPFRISYAAGGSPSCGSNFESVPGLIAGASRTVTFSGISYGSSGSKTLTAEVDSCDDIDESNEQNNTRTATIEVQGGAADLLVASLTASNSSPRVGELFSVEARITNQGDIDAGPFRVSYSTGGSPSCGSNYASVSGLAAGAGLTVTFSGISYGSSGSKTLRVEADPCDSIDEGDEQNNSRSVSINVSSPASDLTITRLTPSTRSPEVDASFSLEIRIMNQGPGDAGSFRVSYARSGSPSCGGNFRTVGGLSAGDSRTLVFTGLTYGSSGARTLSAEIDPCGSVDETDETNNTESVAIDVRSSNGGGGNGGGACGASTPLFGFATLIGLVRLGATTRRRRHNPRTGKRCPPAAPTEAHHTTRPRCWIRHRTPER